MLFGEAGNDNLVGGYGADWISGGTGDDAILGDDGLLADPLNPFYADPFFGVAGVANADIAKYIAALQPATAALPDPSEFVTFGGLGSFAQAYKLFLDAHTGFAPQDANDVIFGGLGNDLIVGGWGDDALSGAEALPVSYMQAYDASGHLSGLVESDYFHPLNTGSPLNFAANGQPGTFPTLPGTDPSARGRLQNAAHKPARLARPGSSPKNRLSSAPA